MNARSSTVTPSFSAGVMLPTMSLAGRDVPCSPDAVDVRAQTVVHRDATATDLEADASRLELLDVRQTARGKQDVRHVDYAAADRSVDAVPASCEGLDPGVQHDVDSLVLA